MVTEIEQSSSDVKKATFQSFFEKVNRDGLCKPSQDAFKIICEAEKCFKVLIHDKKLGKKQIPKIINIRVLSSIWNSVFCLNVDNHLVESAVGDEPHPVKLLKIICNRYIQMRLKTYGKSFTKEVIQGNNCTQRNKNSRLSIFTNV